MRRFTSAIPYTEFTVATGNYDTTRTKIDRVVIHSIVGIVSSAISRFSTKGTQTSAHYIVGNDGRLWAGLEEYWTAYHSGNYAMNQRSIGIEHEWYQGLVLTDKLYQTAGKLVGDICKYHNIPVDRQHILKHSEVIPTACPNQVNIDKIVAIAKSYIVPLTKEQQMLAIININISDTEFRNKVRNIYGV
jgi:N-acetyl-anhydromuramyl-L-alanine amidase AmpD